MNDTLSTPDPAAQVAEVRHILANRGTHPCEAVLIRIGRVIDPPPPSSSWGDTGNGPGYEPPGTAWERHDDPCV